MTEQCKVLHDNRKKHVNEKLEVIKLESWINNVLKIYPEKTREQAEELYQKLGLKT